MSESRFEAYCRRQRAQWGEKFVPPTCPALIAAYNKGDRYRIKVDGMDDRPAWGFVTLTTGWQPSFMLMRTRSQRWSSHLLSERDKIYEGKSI